MNISFDCCFVCVAPKRHPGCHGTCEEYKKAKQEYDALEALKRQHQTTTDSYYDARRYKHKRKK